MESFEVIGENYAITNYDLGHKIGRGAFAEVYRCHKLVNGKLSPEVYVAKKVFFQKNIPNMKELIDREISLMMEQILSENVYVVKIYDYFLSPSKDNSQYIIMEYCEGGDLEKYVDENIILPEKEIAGILSPVAQSFVKLHDANVVHRDLKLANILLLKKPKKDIDPEIRITDFGLAYEMQAQNMAYTMCGTPLYMAPEIWDSGSSRKGYTNKIDVWAFGNMLYKMMYGDYPFDDRQFKKKLAEGIIKFPKLRATSLECFDLMLKCMRKDPKKRTSFKEIAAHPFFTRRKEPFHVFHQLFDGVFGYIEININNEYDLLRNPKELDRMVMGEDLDAFDEYNLSAVAHWPESVEEVKK